MWVKYLFQASICPRVGIIYEGSAVILDQVESICSFRISIWGNHWVDLSRTDPFSIFIKSYLARLSNIIPCCLWLPEHHAVTRWSWCILISCTLNVHGLSFSSAHIFPRSLLERILPSPGADCLNFYFCCWWWGWVGGRMWEQKDSSGVEWFRRLPFTAHYDSLAFNQLNLAKPKIIGDPRFTGTSQLAKNKNWVICYLNM